MRTPSPLPALLAGTLAVLGGCDALDTKYEQASLEQMLKGQVTSSTDRFRIPRPTIPVARRNTGIVREGSSFVIIVGPQLKSVLDTYAAEDTEYGVRLVREPHTFLVLEKVWSSGQENDLFQDVERLRFDFPELVDESEIRTAGFPDYAATERLPEEGSLHLSGFTPDRREIASELRHQLDVARRGNAGASRYFLRSDGTEVLVGNLDPMTQLMLDFLILERKPFDGGVRIVQRLDPPSSDGVTSVVDVRWIRLGGGLCFKAPGGGSAPAAGPVT